MLAANDAFRLADAGLVQLALVCAVAFSASVLGGVSGYGTGLILPVFLAPVVGVQNVIPVMAVGMAINNGSRVVAFRHDIDWTHARRMLGLGLPACVAGAYAYALLSARWIALLLGAFLLVSIPLRRFLAGARFRFSTSGEIGETCELGAGALFGLINGGMTGTGVLLIAILMSAGVQGAALIATDAVVSALMGMAKIVIFSGLAKLDLNLAAAGLLIGVCTAPGAFVARRLLQRIPTRIHAWVMELVILIGALALLWRSP